MNMRGKLLGVLAVLAINVSFLIPGPVGNLVLSLGIIGFIAWAAFAVWGTSNA